MQDSRCERRYGQQVCGRGGLPGQSEPNLVVIPDTVGICRATRVDQVKLIRVDMADPLDDAGTERLVLATVAVWIDRDAVRKRSSNVNPKLPVFHVV